MFKTTHIISQPIQVQIQLVTSQKQLCAALISDHIKFVGFLLHHAGPEQGPGHGDWVQGGLQGVQQG